MVQQIPANAAVRSHIVFAFARSTNDIILRVQNSIFAINIDLATIFSKIIKLVSTILSEHI